MSLALCVFNTDYAVLAGDRLAETINPDGTTHSPHARDVSKLHVHPNLPVVVAQVGNVYDDVLDAALANATGRVADIAESVWSALYEAHGPIAQKRLAEAGEIGEEQWRAINNMEIIVAGFDGSDLHVASANYPDRYPANRGKSGFLAVANYTAIAGVAGIGIVFSQMSRENGIALCKLLMTTADESERICRESGGYRGVMGPLDFLLVEPGSVTAC